MPEQAVVRGGLGKALCHNQMCNGLSSYESGFKNSRHLSIIPGSDKRQGMLDSSRAIM